MSHSRSKYRARGHKIDITRAEASRRAKKGWETRRRNNPHLRNIEYAGRNKYVWNRPSGEKIPIKNFTQDQMELVAPAFGAADEHLKDSQRLNTKIQGKKLLWHNYVTTTLTGGKLGGFVMGVRGEDPRNVGPIDKALYRAVYKVPFDAYGKYNPLTMNLHTLNHPNRRFNPAAILIHEIGHTAGPATAPGYFGRNYVNKKGHSPKEVEKFEKHFQWEAPRSKNNKLNREGSLQEAIDNGLINSRHWAMKANHPNALGKIKKGPYKGLAKAREVPPYQNLNKNEDFAESFRSLHGLPTDVRENKTGSNYFEWNDTKNRSRAKYMKQEHMKKVSAENRYEEDIRRALQTFVKDSKVHETSTSRTNKLK